MAGLSRLMMGIPKKEKGRGACLPHSARSRAVLAGRFLILGAQFFVDALCRGGKPQRGRRIVLKIDHIIIIIWLYQTNSGTVIYQRLLALALAMKICKLNECPFDLPHDYQSNTHFLFPFSFSPDLSSHPPPKLSNAHFYFLSHSLPNPSNPSPKIICL